MDKQANVSKGVNKGLLAMQAANAARKAAKAAKAAMTPEQAVMAAQAALSRKRKADERKSMHQQASISVAVRWQVSVGWREGGSDVLTAERISVEAPAGAVRRAAKLARAKAKAPGKGARFAGVLAVIREDALSLLA